MKLTDVLLYSAILLFIIAVIVSMILVRQEGTKCLSQPISYGFAKLENSVNGSVLCTCSVIGNKIFPTFILTKNGFEILK